MQDHLVEFFNGLNLRQCFDGRFGGACPLPHRGAVACDCEQALYANPVSGSWSWFCSDHLGRTSGTVRAFVALGLVADLTLSEMQSEIGKDYMGSGQVIRGGGRPPNEEDVAARVIAKLRLYRRGDKRKDGGKRPSLWAEAKGYFRYRNISSLG